MSRIIMILKCWWRGQHLFLRAFDNDGRVFKWCLHCRKREYLQ